MPVTIFPGVWIAAIRFENQVALAEVAAHIVDLRQIDVRRPICPQIGDVSCG